jgi:AcrR family transcriptional regulator
VRYGTIRSVWPGKVIEMAKKPIDRRVARTRAMLQQAHVSLILEKGYEATTIEDICDKANVGRSTFYAHYTSKDDLRRSSFEHLRKLLVDRQKEALDSA